VRPLDWLRMRVRELFLVPDYLKTAATQWQGLLFGDGVLAVTWALWVIFGNPPTAAKVLFVFGAAFLAGYYAWRSDHMRLLPKLAVEKIETVVAPISGSEHAYFYIQLVPRCLTQSPVAECQGTLLRVKKKHGDESEWSDTVLDEPLPMEWSLRGHAPLTLQPGILQRLNVCFSPDNAQILVPTVSPLPTRWQQVFNSTGKRQLSRFSPRSAS
jgi:hypothetical protein